MTRYGFAFVVLLLVVSSSGCGNSCDHPAEQCTGLDGYLTYYNGKLDPTQMCGVQVSGGGLHFHWDLPEGICACDVNDSGLAESATWTHCQFTAADGTSSNPGSGPSGPTGSTSTSGSTTTGTGGGGS